MPGIVQGIRTIWVGRQEEGTRQPAWVLPCTVCLWLGNSLGRCLSSPDGVRSGCCYQPGVEGNTCEQPSAQAVPGAPCTQLRSCGLLPSSAFPSAPSSLKTLALSHSWLKLCPPPPPPPALSSRDGSARGPCEQAWCHGSGSLDVFIQGQVLSFSGIGNMRQGNNSSS